MRPNAAKAFIRGFYTLIFIFYFLKMYLLKEFLCQTRFFNFFEKFNSMEGYGDLL